MLLHLHVNQSFYTLLDYPVTNSSTEAAACTCKRHWLSPHTGLFTQLPALAMYWPSPFAPLCPPLASCTARAHMCPFRPWAFPLYPRRSGHAGWSLSFCRFRPLPLELHWPFLFLLLYWPSPLSPCFPSRSGGTGLALSPSSLALLSFALRLSVSAHSLALPLLPHAGAFPLSCALRPRPAADHPPLRSGRTRWPCHFRSPSAVDSLLPGVPFRPLLCGCASLDISPLSSS